ncbi:MAG: RND transporter, partial [Gammaproteobacteria bacterium]
MRTPAALPALAVVLALEACSLSPRYQRPSVPTPPPSYKEAGEWKVAAPADSTPRARWWTMFNDQAL